MLEYVNLEIKRKEIILLILDSLVRYIFWEYCDVYGILVVLEVVFYVFLKVMIFCVKGFIVIVRYVVIVLILIMMLGKCLGKG